MKGKIQDYSKTDIEEMSPMSLFMLMEDKGVDMFGLFAASKSVLLSFYEKQIGFKV